MKISFIILALYIGIGSVYQEFGSRKSIEKEFGWLLGSWERVESENRFVETWTKVNENHFQAKSAAIAPNGDTIFSESIDLLRLKNSVYYKVMAGGQNDGKQVSFKLVSANPWVFENKAHDFPQKIVYSHPSTDSLHAWIEGPNEGKVMRVDFKMKKIQSK